MAGGKGRAVEEYLGGGVVCAFDGGHGEVVVGGAVGKFGGGAAGGVGVGPSGIGSGEGLDLGLGVDGDGIAGGVKLERAVGVERVDAGGEELHEFARVVFVGDLAGGGLVAVEHVEIAAHRGGEADVIHDCGEVGEGIFGQHVLVGRDGTGVDGVGGDDEDLREGEGNALAELVGAGEHGLPPLGLLAGDEVSGGADSSG